MAASQRDDEFQIPNSKFRNLPVWVIRVAGAGRTIDL